MSEDDDDKLPTDCGVCRYHVNKTKECRRHAPHPGYEEDFVVAIWNMTKDRNRCGSGSTKEEIVICSDCTYWWQPENKPLSPPFGQGLPEEWWQNSGYCTHAAPGTTINESRWTFWKVTSTYPHNGSFGGCGDGVSITAMLEAAQEGQR